MCVCVFANILNFCADKITLVVQSARNKKCFVLVAFANSKLHMHDSKFIIRLGAMHRPQSALVSACLLALYLSSWALDT